MSFCVERINTRSFFLFTADRTCPPDTFVCESNKAVSRYPCISMNLVCDGIRYSVWFSVSRTTSVRWELWRHHTGRCKTKEQVTQWILELATCDLFKITVLFCVAFRNCQEGEDEQQSCPPRECRDDQFKCANNICISSSWVCDHDNDCGDMSDEPSNCSKWKISVFLLVWKRKSVLTQCPVFLCLCISAYPSCSSDHFTCDNGRCVPLSFRCDGDNDCRDGSDERDSLCCAYAFACRARRRDTGIHTIYILKELKFALKYHVAVFTFQWLRPQLVQVVSSTATMDSAFHINSSVTNTQIVQMDQTNRHIAVSIAASGCFWGSQRLQLCWENLFGCHVLCLVYVLSFCSRTDFSFADVNECERLSSNQCEHKCVNTITSYYCECNPGFTLMSDRKACRGWCDQQFLCDLWFWDWGLSRHWIDHLCRISHWSDSPVLHLWWLCVHERS